MFLTQLKWSQWIEGFPEWRRGNTWFRGVNTYAHTYVWHINDKIRTANATQTGVHKPIKHELFLYDVPYFWTYTIVLCRACLALALSNSWLLSVCTAKYIVTDNGCSPSKPYRLISNWELFSQNNWQTFLDPDHCLQWKHLAAERG